jgi:hypothetical protein
MSIEQLLTQVEAGAISASQAQAQIESWLNEMEVPKAYDNHIMIATHKTAIDCVRIRMGLIEYEPVIA